MASHSLPVSCSVKVSTIFKLGKPYFSKLFEKVIFIGRSADFGKNMKKNKSKPKKCLILPVFFTPFPHGLVLCF